MKSVTIIGPFQEPTRFFRGYNKIMCKLKVWLLPLCAAMAAFCSCSRSSLPKDYTEYCDSADAEFSAGHYTNALADCSRAIDLNSQSARPFLIRGMVMTRLRHYDLASNAYTEAIRLNPKSDAGYLGRGLAEEIMGAYKIAIDDYNQAINLNPNGAGNAYYHKGSTEFLLHEYEHAIADLSKSIEYNSTNAQAYCNLGHAKYFLSNDVVGAIVDLNKSVELGHDDSALYYDRGNLKRIAKQYNEAINDFDMAIKLNPQLVQAYWSLAMTESDLFQLQAALTNFRNGLALSYDPSIANRVYLIRMQLGEQKQLEKELGTKFKDPGFHNVVETLRDSGYTKPICVAIEPFLYGALSEDELLKNATNAILGLQVEQENLCTAYYYAGMKHLLAGDRSGAVELFRKSTGLPISYGEDGFDEYMSSEVELEALKEK